MNDPILEFYKIIEKAPKVKPSFFIAKIKNPLPNIEVELSDIVLDKEDFSISSSLLKLDSANVTCSTGSITHNLKDVLNKGDEVIILKVGERYILLSKVINL